MAKECIQTGKECIREARERAQEEKGRSQEAQGRAREAKALGTEGVETSQPVHDIHGRPGWRDVSEAGTPIRSFQTQWRGKDLVMRKPGAPRGANAPS